MRFKCQLCTTAVVTVALAVILVLLTSCGAMVINGTEMTMDQAIMAASKSSRIFKLMEDGNTVRVEMDMLFKTEVWEEIMRHRSNASRQARKAIRESRFRWPNATVPYRIAVSFTQSEYQQFQAAISDYDRYTCLKFRPVEPMDRNSLEIVDGSGCSSYVGAQGGRQPVTLATGCRVKGIIIHELGHAIGFNHEQTRSDREDYVSILSDNISPSMTFNFQQYTDAETNNFNISYDYLSVMHYGPYAFTQNGQMTIVTKDQRYQNRIGNRAGLSFRDIKLANAMYDCAARKKCQQRNCSGEGFVGPDCQCWCNSGNDTAPVQLCSDSPQTSAPSSPSPTTSTGRMSPATSPSLATKSVLAAVTTKPSMKASSVTASTVAACRDNSTNCSTWAKQGFCSQVLYRVHMAQHCKLSCNSCSSSGATITSTAATSTRAPQTVSTTATRGNPTATATSNRAHQTVSTTVTRGSATTAPHSSCYDANHMCHEWARMGECLYDPHYMNSHCAKSCNSCHGDSRLSQGCTDIDKDCAYWMSQGYCLSYEYSSYMRLHCPLSCGLCATTKPLHPDYGQYAERSDETGNYVQDSARKATVTSSKFASKSTTTTTTTTTTRRQRQHQHQHQQQQQLNQKVR